MMHGRKTIKYLSYQHAKQYYMDVLWQGEVKFQAECFAV
jgi:hypothetical protein